MEHLILSGKTGQSHIYIDHDVFHQCAKRIAEQFHPSRIHVVTDSNVYPLYFDALKEQFPLSVSVSVIKAGEESKTLDTVAGLYRDFCAAGLTRSDLIIALGGGVVGDIAGFAASSYLRGVSLCQIPTTLLAQVDSSVGGKCGVDLPEGKNLVGAFYQPGLVLIDPNLLDTLQEQVFCDGLAEVIKYGCIANPLILNMLSAPAFRQNMMQIIINCVAIKRDVVEKDERDTSIRMILNFGHTIGHAIEKLGNYTAHAHGQAVAIGMAAALRIGQQLGYQDFSASLLPLLKQHHLPYELPYDGADICKALLSDKKNFSGTMSFILLESLGRAKIEKIEIKRLQELVSAL